MVGILVAASAGASAARSLPTDPPHENVRPFFCAGSSIPVSFDGVDRGFGWGLGFEVERGPRASMLFRFEWNDLQGDPAPAPYPFGYSPRIEMSAMNWWIGARGYLNPGGRVRPYAEGLLGVRVVAESNGYVRAALSGGTEYPENEGMAAAVGLGLSTARPGGAGLFLESRLEVLIHDLRHDGIVPIRFGIVFP